ncbi:MAG: hypothetical protein ABSH45_11575 [Bryobacteraceae bacterium]|jgi:hypothetical protein
MLPEFLIPEATVRDSGAGPEIFIGSHQGETLDLNLGITRIIEQESVDISIWGSSDGAVWSSKPLISFSQKFYCGNYQIELDLSQFPEVCYLRAKWQLNRWGKGDPKPLFTLYLFVSQAVPQMVGAPV